MAALIMVDQLQDEPRRRLLAAIKATFVDGVRPDLPSTGAMSMRALQRLYLRRWMVVLAIGIIWSYVLVYHLPKLPAITGSVLVLTGSAFFRRESIFLQVSPTRTSDLASPIATINAVLEGLPAPVLLLDTLGQVLRFNSQAKDLFPSLRTQQHLSGFIRDPDVLEGVAQASVLRLPREVVRYETRVPIERHMEITIAWIGPAHGKPPPGQATILLYLYDLTEQEALAVMRSDFIANASHELRTPLASVLGFIETLQGAARDDTQARERFLGIMARQAQRMARLIDDLLSLSRIEMRQHLRPQARVDLNSVVQHVAASLEPVAVKSGISLHVSTLPGAAVVQGDRDELVQVFSNLVENAIKYGESDGNVWISVEARGRKFATSVRDDGIGIDEKHLPRLTERFYRANDKGGERSGTGLGLAIVKHTVSRHRGELSISSKTGEGSAFTVLLEAVSHNATV
jgi:two-component system, OmpR family, phosphate regulon sensor histidine kinase PhoR